MVAAVGRFDALVVGDAVQAVFCVLVIAGAFKERNGLVRLPRGQRGLGGHIAGLLRQGCGVGHIGRLRKVRDGGGIVAVCQRFAAHLVGAFLAEHRGVAVGGDLVELLLGGGVIAGLHQLHRRLIQAGRGFQVAVQIIPRGQVFFGSLVKRFLREELVAPQVVGFLHLARRVRVGVGQLRKQRDGVAVLLLLHGRHGGQIQAVLRELGGVPVLAQRQELRARLGIVQRVHQSAPPQVVRLGDAVIGILVARGFLKQRDGLGIVLRLHEQLRALIAHVQRQRGAVLVAGQRLIQVLRGLERG